MKLSQHQLSTHLQKTITPIYFVCGDETLLVDETCQTIRRAAELKGYAERQVFHVEPGFDWDNFISELRSFSLFSTHVFVELQLRDNKLNDAGKKALQTYAEKPCSDKILLICSPKLETKTYSTKWLKAIDKTGVILQIWPVDRSALPAWIKQRLRSVGLQIDPQGLQLLVEQSEGNLLALAQNIEKLRLSYGENHQLSPAEIASAISDTSRFNVFELADAMLLGNDKQTLRIITSLKAEGVEPILILWALTRELRNLITIANAIQQGTPIAKAYQQAGVWDKRKPLFHKALQHGNLQHWHTLLIQASRIDKIIKGVEQGNVWDELRNLTLNLTLIEC